MAVGDDTAEARASSLGISSVEFDIGGTMVSPDDVAWADSCLKEDPEILENGWNSLKEALLDTLGSQPDSASHERENLPEGDKMEISPPCEGTGYAYKLVEAAISITDPFNALEPSPKDFLSLENPDDFWSKHSMKDVFLPTYNENLKDLGTFGPESDLVSHALELDQSNTDIFKLWDFGLPPEEDELTKEWNKALEQGSFEPNISVSDDFNASKDLKDAPLDDLISGIKDLLLR